MKCPTCDKDVKWQDNLYRPFCSERCKLLDLGRWVNDEYRVPGRELVQDAGMDDQRISEDEDVD